MLRFLLLLLLLVLLITACREPRQVDPRLAAEMPKNILWAWERPEDLRFVDTKQYGVAFLAQTLLLEKNSVIPKPRRQPLELADGTYIIAVTRVETNKNGGERPALDDAMATRVADLIRATIDLPKVKALQVDFDAVSSERAFYRTMMSKLRARMPPDVALTMTSLASWCVGDAWFNDFPVDEAVPMAFQMGADSEKIRGFLRGGSDWREPLCRGSYGISVDERDLQGLKIGRRMYYFKNTAWDKDSVPLADAEPAQAPLDISSACELTADPKRFDGKLVRLNGVLSVSDEGTRIGVEQCTVAAGPIFISRKSESARSEIGTVLASAGGRLSGSLIGTFRAEPFENCCTKAPYKFELVKLENGSRAP